MAAGFGHLQSPLCSDKQHEQVRYTAQLYTCSRLSSMSGYATNHDFDTGPI